MSNPNRKLKGTGERYSHEEKTLKNCLSQNGSSLLGFLRRLHFSELEKNSDGNQPSCRLGWLSYSASGFPTQAVLSERSPENWWMRVVSLCEAPGKAFGVPLGVISSPSWRHYSPQKNFRTEHCLKTELGIGPKQMHEIWKGNLKTPWGMIFCQLVFPRSL